MARRRARHHPRGRAGGHRPLLLTEPSRQAHNDGSRPGYIVSSVKDLSVQAPPAAANREAAELLAAISAVRRTARQAVRKAWHEEPLPTAQSELLRLVADRPGITVAEAARELRLAPNTVSTLVGRLAEPGPARPGAGPGRRPLGAPQRDRPGPAAAGGLARPAGRPDADRDTPAAQRRTGGSSRTRYRPCCGWPSGWRCRDRAPRQRRQSPGATRPGDPRRPVRGPALPVRYPPGGRWGRPVDRGRRDVRPARPERGRQDDHHPDADHPAETRRRERSPSSAWTRPSSRCWCAA